MHNHRQEINKILLIGGSSQLTLIKEQFATLLPNASVETCGEKDIAVALGNNYVENITKSEPASNSTGNEEDSEIDVPLNTSKSIKCKNPLCGSEKCYKIMGRPGYHCVECGWEGANVTVTFNN